MKAERLIDREAVREALHAARVRGAKTTTAAIYTEELPLLFGKKGQWAQVARWLKEIKEEERAAAAGDLQIMAPADPLPEAVAVTLDNGVKALTGCFNTLAGSLSATLTVYKAELCREKDLAVAAIQVGSDLRVVEAEDEMRDAMFAAERFEAERDATLQKADNLAAELAACKEALAAANARGEELANTVMSAKKDAKSERERADLAVLAASDFKAEAARLAAELKAASGRKEVKNA